MRVPKGTVSRLKSRSTNCAKVVVAEVVDPGFERTGRFPDVRLRNDPDSNVVQSDVVE